MGGFQASLESECPRAGVGAWLVPGSPGAPQSQHTSLPVILCTSEMISLVSSWTMLFSPVLSSPLNALFRASSLLFCSTDIHLGKQQQSRVSAGWTRPLPPLVPALPTELTSDILVRLPLGSGTSCHLHSKKDLSLCSRAYLPQG